MSADSNIHRCPICGEWAWCGTCYIPHENRQKETP